MQADLLKIFYDETIINNRLPVNFREKDSAIFGSAKTIKVPQSGLFLFKDVRVTDLGILYKNMQVLKENIICYDIDFKIYRFKYFLKAFLKFKKLDFKGNKAILLFDNYSGPNGFAHWICDGLTRFAEINDTLHDYTVIVPAYFKDQGIYFETLKLFNISSIHYLEKDTLTHFKELYFPSPIGETGNFHPTNLDKLRTIVSTMLNLNTAATKNIYISRAKAKRRFIKNEKDVLKVLSKYDFEIYYLEDHTFSEQIKIVNSAANIISIHGAALALLAFAKEGASVMELRSKSDDINNMYYILANASKLNYYYLNCLSIFKTNTGNNFDLAVDITELEENVKQMVLKAK
ncbi:MAG: glycosyltransferase family 61 protein [Bacteroidetes bacterium]|nr:glycosyltransferase family 61 protein [Bacteroidota bacterium]